MSIFNSEEMTKLRDDVQTLQKQVEELRNAIGNVGESPGEAQQPVAPPSETPPETCNRQEGTDRTLQELVEKMNVLAERIDTAAYQEKLIRDMHQELVQLKKGLLADLKKDYLMDIINICERMGDTDRHIRPDAPDFDAQKAKLLVTNTYLYIRDHLADEYSVEYFEPAVGDAYDPKCHRAIRVNATDDDAKAGTIAECLAGGFRNTETDRVFRQARVVVFRKES